MSQERHDRWPEDGLETVPACPICAGTERRLMYRGLRDRIFFSAPGAWDMFGCNECGAGFLDPRPTSHTIGLAYRSYYTHTQRRSAPAATLKASLRRLLAALANGYREVHFGMSKEPSLRVGARLARFAPGQKALLERSARHLPKPWPGCALLDIGCGNGDFLALAQSAGWRSVGIEPDERAASIARSRGLEIHEGDIQVLSRIDKAFDVITLSHVIEHVHDPMAVLACCHRLLKQGGILWLETPNLDSLGHSCYGEAWRDLDPPRHLVLFTGHALTRAMEKTGFSNIEPLWAGPLCRQIFAASEAIRRKDSDPFNCTHLPLRAALQAFWCDRLEARHWQRREFLTLRARKNTS